MSGELEIYLERKSICMVEGVPEDQAIEIAHEQIKPLLKNWMPDIVHRDLKRIGKL
jgi:hypothetical protein